MFDMFTLIYKVDICSYRSLAWVSFWVCVSSCMWYVECDAA